MNEINLASVIAAKRREKGVTQEELAAYIGVSKASVSKWETGHSYPDVTFLPLLAAYFDISIDQLMSYSPQLEADGIKMLYRRLAADFAEKPFEEVMAECDQLIRKYYSCYPLLLQFAYLYINHASLASDPERVKQIMSEASRLCDRIRENSKDVRLIREAVNGQAMCYLSLGDGAAALELIGDFPHFGAASDSTFIAQAYQLLGNRDKAQEVTQAELFVNLMNIFTSLICIVTGNLDNLEKSEPAFLRAERLAELFNMRCLNPNNMAILYGVGAQMYMLNGSPEKALENLSKYTDLCINDFFPFTPRGDSFFDRIQDWLNETAGPMPRDEEVVKESMLRDIALNPVFEPLLNDPEYQKLVKRLKEFAGGS